MIVQRPKFSVCLFLLAGPPPVYYAPFPSEAFRTPPCYMPANPSDPGHQSLPSDAPNLKDSIVTQIEYYFRFVCAWVWLMKSRCS